VLPVSVLAQTRPVVTYNDVCGVVKLRNGTGLAQVTDNCVKNTDKHDKEYWKRIYHHSFYCMVSFFS